MRMAGSIGSSFASPSAMTAAAGKNKKRSTGVVCAAAAGTGNLMEQYRTLRIQPGASEKEVKRAFRQLALEYHPDVCKGSNCGVQFYRINEAYDMVMSNLRASEEQQQEEWQSQDWSCDDGDEQFRGMYDSSWDLWEEWMGWEGAGIRDYSSHINPYI